MADQDKSSEHDHHHHHGEEGHGDCSDAPPFTENDLISKTNPFPQMKAWGEEGKSDEYSLRTLSTVSEDGMPSSRYIGLVITDSCIKFMTCDKSNKANEFSSNPRACALFYWPSLDRQMIVKGRVEKLPREEFLEMYKYCPSRECQVTVNMGDQDEVLTGYEELVKRRKETEVKFEGVESLPAPDSWQCYCLKPIYFEFYQGHHNWQSDRIVYTQEPDSSWSVKRFLP